MGNRAFIASEPYKPENVGIYVHWNGGQESIEGFCRAARTLRFRNPVDDDSYGMARLCQLIANYFGNDGLSVGIGTGTQLADAGDDNGIWVLGRDWKITAHLTCKGKPIPLGALDEQQEEKAVAIHDDVVAKTRRIEIEEKA